MRFVAATFVVCVCVYYWQLVIQNQAGKRKRYLLFYMRTQGCQLPDFSLRSQTFCYIADFSTTFYICWKLRLFCISHHKTTSKHPKTQKFRLYFAKTFCNFKNSLWPRQKLGKAPTQLVPPVPGQASGLRQRIRWALREVSRLFWNTMLAALSTIKLVCILCIMSNRLV